MGRLIGAWRLFGRHKSARTGKMLSDNNQMSDGSSSAGSAEPTAASVTVCRCVLSAAVLLALADCWCRSAIGCRPATAGGTKLRPLTVSAAFCCALVGSIAGIVDALAPSLAVRQARAVAVLAAAGICWCVAAVVLRTSLWREESCCGATLGQIGRHLPLSLVAVLAVLATAGSCVRAIAKWPIRSGLHLQDPDDEVTALLASPGPSALLLAVLLSGCFAKADGSLSPGETLCLIFAALLAGAAGSVATKFAVHAELAQLPKSFGPEALCAALLTLAAISAWCGLRQWVCQPSAGSESGRRGGMWSNSSSSGLGASLLADESADEEDGFKSRLPPTIMKPKVRSKPEATLQTAGARAGGSAAGQTGSSPAGQLALGGGDEMLDEAQRLAGVASRGSRARPPPRRRSRAENSRRLDGRRPNGSSDESSDDSEDPPADADEEEDQDRRRMPPPEPRRRAAAPASASSSRRDTFHAIPAATSQQQTAQSESSPEAAADPRPGVQGGPGAVAAAAMALRRAYRSGRERKKRNAWEGAVSAFGEALKEYQAAVDSGADAGGGIALGGGFSSSVRVPSLPANTCESVVPGSSACLMHTFGLIRRSQKVLAEAC